MARTSAFFGSVTPKAFCQKRLKLAFPAPFFFGSFLFGRTKRNEHIKKEGVPFETPSFDYGATRSGTEARSDELANKVSNHKGTSVQLRVLNATLWLKSYLIDVSVEKNCK
jgi:hypothetical protein